MTRRGFCKHERTRFHSVQRLGTQPPVELRHCLACHSTIAAAVMERGATAGVAASH